MECKKLSIIGSGRFATIWSGLYGPDKAAIKTYDEKYADDYWHELAVLTSLGFKTCKNGAYRDHVCRLLGAPKVGHELCTPLGKMDLYRLTEEASAKLAFNVQCDIIDQITKGLAYIHANGYIHADLKAENVIVEQTIEAIQAGEEPRLFICDFNSAIKKPSKKTGHDVLCTIDTAAPEVLLDGPVTEKIDIWALGCIIFEIFTGAELFISDNEEDAEDDCYGMPPLYVNYTLTCISELLGDLPREMRDYGGARKYFTKEGKIRHSPQIEEASAVEELTEEIREATKVSVKEKVAMVLKCIKYRPQDRPSATDLLKGKKKNVIKSKK